ncbi:MAG: hypothetical protein HOV80_06215 [Polyangiaceae bacterium]|nr:hypothetical protein [Polyangiaceae bacterium]
MDSRGIGPTALRGAALTLSIGIVAALMVRASSGCSDKSDIGADPAKSTPASSAAGATTGDPEKPYGIHFPATKAEGGSGMRKLLTPSGDAAAEAPASAATSAQPNVAIENDPSFFPASKSGPPMPRRQEPQLQQQKNPAPAQQGGQ